MVLNLQFLTIYGDENLVRYKRFRFTIFLYMNEAL